MNYEKLVQGILNIGEAMLQCGAEIFRVEDSLYRMYKSYGFMTYDVYVIPSNIQVTVETPEGIVVDGMLQPTQEYADHLVNALATNGIRTKKVIFTISSTRVASREVQIPNVKASKIEALVKTNANEYFPVDLTQYEIGHYLAGGLTENGKLRVMALAVPKALLDSYYQLAQMCGWEVECFDYSSNSLYQILRDEKSEKVTMVIKIDENSTIVTVLSAGKVLLQRTVAYGVQDAIDTMPPFL